MGCREIIARSKPVPAGTLEELAEKAGNDAGGLTATVARFNDMVGKGMTTILVAVITLTITFMCEAR